MSDSHPVTWEISPLDDLIIFALGGDWGKDSEFNDPDYTKVHCIRASEIKRWEEEKGLTAAIRKIKKSSLEKRRLIDGDLLVEISGGGPEQPVGRTVLINQEVLRNHPKTPKICTNFFRLIRPSSYMDSKYLNLFLQHFYQAGDIGEYQGGSNNLRNLKFNDYLQLSVPISPLNEQRRIVAKIETLFSELDKGIEALKAAREQLKVYRQAVLKHAFEGKLTSQWREENKDKLETPKQLFVRIKKERELCYQAQLKKWEAAVKRWENKRGGDKKPKKPKLPGTLELVDADSAGQLKQLPSGWVYIKLGGLIAELDQGWSPKCENRSANKNEWGVIKTTAIQHGVFNQDENKALPVSLQPKEQHVLNVNDILITRAGPRVRVGVCCMVRKVRNKLMNCDKVYRFRSINSICRPDYIEGVLNSPRILGEVERIKSGINDSGVNLNQNAFLNLAIPYCSTEEQEEVILRVEQVLSVINKQEETIQILLDMSEVLRQSILKKAFSGQLVPQDSNDEPASVLLERIREEKASQPKSPSRRKLSKKKTAKKKIAKKKAANKKTTKKKSARKKAA